VCVCVCVCVFNIQLTYSIYRCVVVVVARLVMLLCQEGCACVEKKKNSFVYTSKQQPRFVQKQIKRLFVKHRPLVFNGDFDRFGETEEHVYCRSQTQ